MAKAKLGGVLIDTVTSESIKFDADISEHSVERGQDISDHTKNKAMEVDFAGVLIGKDANTRLQLLKKYQRESTLIYCSSRNTYGNMFIRSISPDYSYRNKDGFAFSMVLRQVRIVSGKTVVVKIVNPTTKKASSKIKAKVKKKTNNGRQQPKNKKVSKPAPKKKKVTSSKPKPSNSTPRGKTTQYSGYSQVKRTVAAYKPKRMGGNTITIQEVN